MERIELLRSIARRHGVSPTLSSEQQQNDEAGETVTKAERQSIAPSTSNGITDPNTENTGKLPWSSDRLNELSASEIPPAESESRGPPNVAMMRQVLWQTMMDMKAGKISIEKAREVSQAANVIYKFVRLELDAQKMANKKNEQI